MIPLPALCGLDVLARTLSIRYLTRPLVPLPRCNLIFTGKCVFAVYYYDFSHVPELAFGIWRREPSILQFDRLMYILLQTLFIFPAISHELVLVSCPNKAKLLHAKPSVERSSPSQQRLA